MKTVEEAFNTIDGQEEGIPYQAIRFLRKQPSSEKILEKVKFALAHAYDETCPTPLWYGIVAEKHFDERLIDPVIGLFTSYEVDWDFLNEQGMYVLGLLAEKYPDLVMDKVMRVIENSLAVRSDTPYHFLFETFYFVNKKKYTPWFLKILRDQHLVWKDALAVTLADLQIKEALPILKLLYEEADESNHEKIEFDYAIKEIEAGVHSYPDQAKPWCQQRKDWEEHYSKFEDSFYNEDEEEFIPVPKKKLGRNDHCYCGSGKKYKKCCLLKENEIKIYQLKVTLKGSKPPIWRRVLVKSNFTLGDLHKVIQGVMESWGDDHLHMFMVNGEYYGEQSERTDSDNDEESLTLREILQRRIKKFNYTYDFGDDWEHTIIIEKELELDSQQKYPVCVAGKRACPPEDIGGIWGYEDFVAAQDPKSKGHKAMKELWDGAHFYPEKFDLEEINRELGERF